ncbi:hypothetical protein CQ393_06090 [Stenotrophomonas sp. MYb238]|uniref:protease inhibitor I42 family protein n=1 Tax=Stenotrophomonas sp. MYb238 TaxID=2040281 RepID=UPI001291429F|nr:protease inhibitor I42 family protein [Stenotrophomonas sp. MYb238]MQP75460.1 hypothetical protein [Stenotrophomonas sp. MYb238]
MIRPSTTLALLLGLAACQGQPPQTPPTIVHARADSANTLEVGQILEVALEGNAGTGYQWQVVESGQPQLAAIAPSADTATAAPARPGGPVLQRLRFRAEQPGQALLRLEYRRPWERGEPAARTADYRVDVR